MTIILGQNNEPSKAHIAMVESWKAPDAHSYGVFNVLDSVYKALKEKIVDKNDFMRRLVTSGLNPINILSYPMCGKCETLALWNGFGVKNGKVVSKCTCTAAGCGHTTYEPVMLRTWLFYELKHKAPPDISDTLELTFDKVAARMVDIARTNLNIALVQHEAETTPQMVNAKPDFEIDRYSREEIRTHKNNQLDESEIEQHIEEA